MTFSELKSARATAGVAYQSAVQQLRDAYIELAALDAALANGNVGHGEVVRTFGRLPQNVDGFMHAEFAPIYPAIDWRDLIAARRDQLLKSFGN